MRSWLRRYARWLHLGWPAGEVERLPEVDDAGATRVRGLEVAGDLTGTPLLKLAIDSGVRAARRAAAARGARTAGPDPTTLDLAIVGAGIAGIAAAIEARRLGLRVEVIEAAEPFATIAGFPRAKPIYTYPTGYTPPGEFQVAATVKEDLLAEVRAQAERAGIAPRAGRAERVEREGARLVVVLEGGARVVAERVLVAIGRSGAYRRLGVAGEDLPHVFRRLHDPADFAGRRVAVVGGGDAALETALALASAGASVTVIHRGDDFARAKPENVTMLERRRADPEAPVAIEHPASDQETTATSAATPARAGAIDVRLRTRVRAIAPGAVEVEAASGAEAIAAEVVFVMIGRQAPLGFFRRSGVPIRGEWTAATWAGLAAFLAFCAWLYDWKSGGVFSALWYRNGWFPTNLMDLLREAGGAIAAAAADRRTVLGTLAISASGPAFWYTLAYSVVIVVFGWRRIRRRRTPYVTAQTATLMAIQVLPLFLLPELLLPLADAQGWLPRAAADALFPAADYGHGREFWRAYGFVLAWPLNVYNVFTPEPLPWWLAISFVQTFVLIPIAIWYFGKGAYCGWVCSCGALAETLGDTHREKMPHGPGWNRFNFAGQIVLAIAVALLAVRIAGWALPDGNAAARVFPALQERYKWIVDVFLAGVVGYGVYFWLSGRFWCRFLCPLAALMHVYARFSRFRIFADKKKCISCGQCTRVCHQGIDVMSFANKGLPMADPQCVRCSACVWTCPTGVLDFGRTGASGLVTIDALAASPVRIREGDGASPPST